MTMTDQQPVLFEGESDEALFVPDETLRKRYTATQVKAIEAKRDLILLCFSTGMPVEKIAAAGRVNLRTVQALVGKHASLVASNSKEFARALHSLGAQWMGLAATKAADAKFGELAVAAGIAIQRGNELSLLGANAEETAAVEADTVTNVRERVRLMLQNAKGGETSNNERPTSNVEQEKGELCHSNTIQA